MALNFSSFIYTTAKGEDILCCGGRQTPLTTGARPPAAQAYPAGPPPLEAVSQAAQGATLPRRPHWRTRVTPPSSTYIPPQIDFPTLESVVKEAAAAQPLQSREGWYRDSYGPGTSIRNPRSVPMVMAKGVVIDVPSPPAAPSRTPAAAISVRADRVIIQHHHNRPVAKVRPTPRE